MSLRTFTCRLGGVVLALWGVAGIVVGQEEQAAVADRKFSAEELEKLLAPIALYPDTVLAQVLAASTYPSDVVLANRWVQAKNDPATLDEKEWDPSVKALTRFPAILKKMDEELAWTAQLGEAYLNQPKDVMAAVQTLRAKAKDAGSLQETPEQRVIVEKGAIEIVPADPEIVYVPIYSPSVVYYPNTSPTLVWMTFWPGVPLGPWAYLGCDWRHGYVCYHRWRGHGYVSPLGVYQRYGDRRGGHGSGGDGYYQGSRMGRDGHRWARDGHRGPAPHGSSLAAGGRHRGGDVSSGERSMSIGSGDRSVSMGGRRGGDGHGSGGITQSPQGVSGGNAFSGRGHGSRGGTGGSMPSGSSGLMSHRSRHGSTSGLQSSNAMSLSQGQRSPGFSTRSRESSGTVSVPSVQRNAGSSVRSHHGSIGSGSRVSGRSFGGHSSGGGAFSRGGTMHGGSSFRGSSGSGFSGGGGSRSSGISSGSSFRAGGGGGHGGGGFGGGHRGR